MIHYKSKAEIEILRENSLLVGKAIAHVTTLIKPGVTTFLLDQVAEQFIRDNGGVPNFKGYKGYPYAACISVNEVVVHGFPNKKELLPGDIITVDMGVYKNGYHGDSAYTFGIGELIAEDAQLLKITKESLYKGIAKAVEGNRVGDISYAVQEHTERLHGYGVVRDLVGHGIGKQLHEDPQVANYGKRGSGAKLKQGMVINIEPMINLGTKDVVQDEDGWTIRTADNRKAAHFEHTVSIQKGKSDILSSFDEIETAEKANQELYTAE